MAQTKSKTVQGAQLLLRTHQPGLLIDGAWGPKTDNAYKTSPTDLRGRVESYVTDSGWTIESLKRKVQKEASGLSISEGEFLTAAKASGVVGKSLANLMAVVRAESGFKATRESHVYRSMAQVRGAKLSNLYHLDEKGLADLVAQGPDAFFRVAYLNKAGNGNNADYAAAYIGRGLIQLTGRPNYAEYSADTGSDAVNNPDIVATSKEEAIKSAIWFWKKKVGSAGTDIVKAVSRVGPGLAAKEVQKRVQYAAEYQRIIA